MDEYFAVSLECTLTLIHFISRRRQRIGIKNGEKQMLLKFRKWTSEQFQSARFKRESHSQIDLTLITVMKIDCNYKHIEIVRAALACDVTSCSLVDGLQIFWKNMLPSNSRYYPGERGSKLLRNVDKYLPNSTVWSITYLPSYTTTCHLMIVP